MHAYPIQDEVPPSLLPEGRRGAGEEQEAEVVGSHADVAKLPIGHHQVGGGVGPGGGLVLGPAGTCLYLVEKKSLQLRKYL